MTVFVRKEEPADVQKIPTENALAFDPLREADIVDALRKYHPEF